MGASPVLLTEMDEFMEFEVGDHVAMVQGGLSFEEALLMRPPVRLVIVERIIRQCSGGVQASYVVRLFNPQGEEIVYRAVCTECGSECEVPFKPHPQRPVYCKACWAVRRGGRNRPLA